MPGDSSTRAGRPAAAVGALGAWLVLYVVFVKLLELFLFEVLLPIGL